VSTPKRYSYKGTIPPTGNSGVYKIMSTDNIDPIEDIDDAIPQICPSCGSRGIVTEKTEVICKECGLVLGYTQASTSPEWRAFSKEERERRERTGAPLSQSVHDKGLSTVIGSPAAGTSKEQRELIYRIKKWQARSRVHSSTDRNLIQAMSELARIADMMNLPFSIKEKSAQIYRQALEADLVRGRSIAAIVAASVYAACRMFALSRTLSDVAAVSTVSKKDIARCYRLMLREMELEVPVPDSTNKISAIALQIGIDEDTQRLAASILDRAKELKLTAGKDPMGLAAAALYIACQLNEVSKTQKIIAGAAGVTEVTIRNRYKGLKEALVGLDEIDPRFSEFMQGNRNDTPTSEDSG